MTSGSAGGTARRWRRMAARWAFAVALAAAPGHVQSARAETLQEALEAAYRSNPRLDAERARLRATDEEVARAMSGYRPQVGAAAQGGRETNTTKPSQLSDGASDPWAYQISVTQPIFNGFRTTNEVNQSEAEVRAGRENLRRVEAETLLDAVQAYVDVVRDQAIMRIRERNVDVLSRELEAAQTRRAAREVTRTDVAQAEARRARAMAEADRARANLKIARARYLQVVGHGPENLKAPPLTNKRLPKSLADALDIAARESPNVLSALYREEASRYNVDKVWGELLPQVNLDASYSKSGDWSGVFADEQQGRIGGRVTIPLYDGGEVRARVRQAKHTQVSRLQEIEQARAETEANVSAAWSRLMAARAQQQSDEIQVSSSATALEGTREEERVGQRTLLDVLNAEQEYLEAQVQAVATKSDLIVAGFAVLAQIGRLNGESLDRDGLVYDPEEHYAQARDEWFSTDITYREVGAPQHAEVIDAAVSGVDLTIGAPIIVEKPSRVGAGVRLRPSAAHDVAEPEPFRLRGAQE